MSDATAVSRLRIQRGVDRLTALKNQLMREQDQWVRNAITDALRDIKEGNKLDLHSPAVNSSRSGNAAGECELEGS